MYLGASSLSLLFQITFYVESFLILWEMFSGFLLGSFPDRYDLVWDLARLEYLCMMRLPEIYIFGCMIILFPLHFDYHFITLLRLRNFGA